MDFLKALLSALPTAASTPLAFAAYVLVIAAWLVIAVRVKRNRQLLDSIEKLPESDRLKALQLEMGAIQVRAGLTAEQWLRSRVQLYYFLGFCLLCILAVVVFAIAISKPLPRADATPVADARVTGDWHAAWKDADYAPDGNQFFFRLKASGGSLLGTATRVYNPHADQTDGYMHAISDGKVDGNTISFSYIGETKHDSGNGESTGIKELFRGTISGDTIHFTYQPDGGIHPVEFTANRIMQAGR